MQHSFTVAVTLFALLMSASPARAQPDAASSFAEANSLFRSGLYHAALLRYREANAAGLDTPLLHYNLGIVHYKIGEHDDATHWLERALASPELAPMAAYNLGLAHRAAGRTDEARGWFERAAASARSRTLRELAVRAQSAPNPRGMAGQARTAERAHDPREPLGGPGRIGKLHVLASARYGQDDNVYGAPTEPYVDLAATGQPTVTPVVYSAAFMPVDVVAEYVIENEARDTEFFFGYRLNGDFYDSEFSNANRISQRFDVGADIVLAERENRRRTVKSAFFLRSNAESNFDPDSGVDREVGNIDLSDRFSYRAAGAEGEFGHEIGAWYWGFDMQLEKRVHEDVPLLENYDHEFYFSRINVEYAFGAKTIIAFALRRYRRIYDERLARDSNGELLASNDVLRYDYRGAQLGVTRDITNAFAIGLDLLMVDRVDEFVGYNDYRQNVARLRAQYRPSRRFEIGVAAVARTYEYPNAFVFNEPTAGLRETDGTGIEVDFEFRVNSRMSLWAELATQDFTSTDPRASYGRTLTMLGMRWRR